MTIKVGKEDRANLGGGSHAMRLCSRECNLTDFGRRISEKAFFLN
jgi:hypothetical protein